jgi:hypothetical protein
MIVYVLFVDKKISFKEKSLYYSHKKLKKLKNQKKKTFLVGCFRWVFLVGFFIANPDCWQTYSTVGTSDYDKISYFDVWHKILLGQ